MESLNQRTFWPVVGALFALGGVLLGVVWGEVSDHDDRPYHAGTPFYVEQRLDIATNELVVEIRALRSEIQLLREALIAQGVQLR
jgi:hypothetical protein